MKKLSREEMKFFFGGVAQKQVVTGWTNNDGVCTVDLCWVDTTTGAVSGCRCDIPTGCASWMN